MNVADDGAVVGDDPTGDHPVGSPWRRPKGWRACVCAPGPNRQTKGSVNYEES